MRAEIGRVHVREPAVALSHRGADGIDDKASFMAS